jgi:hypothetical protein
MYHEAGGSCAVNKIHVAVPATAVTSAANAKGRDQYLPVWLTCGAILAAPDQTGSCLIGACGTNYADSATRLKHVGGDVDLLSP